MEHKCLLINEDAPHLLLDEDGNPDLSHHNCPIASQEGVDGECDEYWEEV
jgi:hypothetical protein